MLLHLWKRSFTIFTVSLLRGFQQAGNLCGKQSTVKPQSSEYGELLSKCGQFCQNKSTTASSSWVKDKYRYLNEYSYTTINCTRNSRFQFHAVSSFHYNRVPHFSIEFNSWSNDFTLTRYWFRLFRRIGYGSR